MRQIFRFAGVNAAAAMKSIFAMLLCVFVIGALGITMVSCETETDTIVDDCPNCPDPDPDPNPDPEPEVTVKSVTKIGCDFGANTWTAENAVLTRNISGYELANRDGGIFGRIDVIYNARTNFSDNTAKESSQQYSVNHTVAGFGYRGVRFLPEGGMKIFNEEPEISHNGDITFLTWGDDDVQIAFRSFSEKSVKSLTFDGVEKTDLCGVDSEYGYDRTEIINQGDSASFTKYLVRIYGTVIASDGEDYNKGFYIEMNFREAQNGGVTPPDPIDPEIVGYDLINKEKDENGASGDLIVIKSDGSEENLGRINILLRSSTFINPEQTVKVADFAYIKQPASYTDNIRTGNVRSDYQLGCQIQITEMKNTITMKTDKAVATMGGIYEIPVLIDPMGIEHYWDTEGWKITETGITDNGGSGNVMILTYTANASYYGTNQTLASIVNLIKEDGGSTPDPGEKIQIDAYAKDAHIEGEFIKWTLVRTFLHHENEEIPMSVRHMGKLTVESRRTTFDRTYATTTPAMDLISMEPFRDGNYSGSFCQYTSSFVYPDFTNIISSEGRTIVNYNDNGFEMNVWNEALLVEKTGVDKGTQNISDNPNQIVYLDYINYRLTNGGTEVASGRQEVAYTENSGIDPGPDPTQQTGAYAKDARIDGPLIRWTLVRTYNNADDQEIPMSIRHLGSLTTEERKITETRNYTAATPEMNLVSRESFTENNYFGTFCKYTSNFVYADFTNIISSQGRTIVNYNDNGFEMKVWNEELLVEKTGEELGVYDISDNADYATYLDYINYHLTNGGAEVATGKQEVAYTTEAGGEDDEDVITRTFQEDGVEDGKLYYYYIVTHSKHPELNSKTRHSIDLTGSISVQTVDSWTTKIENAGFNLTGNTDQAYDSPRDYTFTSNRGNNTAAASLQTEYTVTHDGTSHTFTVTGNVKASVNRTASTETSNTYTFKADLYVNGVLFKSSSANVVETIESDQPEDKVEKVIVKDRVENNKLYYIYKETHSQNTDENITEEGSVDLTYSLSAVAVNDWTAEEGRTGISLSGSSSQTFVGNKDYIFVSNRGNNIAKASLQTEYQISMHGITQTLTISGRVDGSVALISSSQNTNTYQFTAKLFADNVELVSKSDNAVETIEKDEPEDVITRKVEKTGVQNGTLYYNYIVTHSVNTDENSTTPYSIPLVSSLTATAVNDWTAEEGQTGFSLTGNKTQSYGSAGRYTFSSNRGNNYADASLQTSYVVTHDGQNFTLTVNGTISGETSGISSTETTNSYRFTARLLADGVEIANASDECIETVEPKKDPNPYGIIAVYSTIAWGMDNGPHVTLAARYDNGNCILYVDGRQVYKGTAPSGTISAIPNNSGWEAASITEIGDSYFYRGVNGGFSNITKHDITYKGYPSGILDVNVTTNDDGSWYAANNYTNATFGQY